MHLKSTINPSDHDMACSDDRNGGLCRYCGKFQVQLFCMKCIKCDVYGKHFDVKLEADLNNSTFTYCIIYSIGFWGFCDINSLLVISKLKLLAHIFVSFPSKWLFYVFMPCTFEICSSCQPQYFWVPLPHIGVHRYALVLTNNDFSLKKMWLCSTYSPSWANVVKL